MATGTRFPTTTVGADADVLAGISLDRINLRFALTFVPIRYEYEADGTTHKVNAAGEKAVTPVAGGYTFWPTLPTVFGLQTGAIKGIKGGASIDAAQVAQAEALRNAAVAKWDEMVAAHTADPENAPEPTVEAVAEAVGCSEITGDHPFRGNA